MMNVCGLIAVAGLIGTSAGERFDDAVDAVSQEGSSMIQLAVGTEVSRAFQTFKKEHGKKYLVGEEQKRFKIFSENYEFIRSENAKGLGFTLGINRFADMTFSEFAAERLSPPVQAVGGGEVLAQAAEDVGKVNNVRAPSTVDWRPKLVNPIKDQGQYGSGWAFSTVASLEGAYAKATAELVSLSEQDLVDCVKKDGVKMDSYKSGGLAQFAFEYMMQSQDGFDATEASYPYTGSSGSCQYSKSKAFTGAQITGFKDVPSKDEDALKDAVANQGVVSIAVNAAHHWQLYSGGILDIGFQCNSDQLDHGVAVVGYGTEDKDYWIVRNSWGPSWGEQGYIRLVRGKNMCGVASGPPSYPTLSTA